MRMANLWIFPGKRLRVHVVRQKNFLGSFPRDALCASRVIRFALFEFLRSQEERLAFLQRQKIHEMCGLAIGRAVPVGPSRKSWTNARSEERRVGKECKIG